MKAERLVQMANDIGSFFASEKDPSKAAAGVANHIRMFWDPRMRRELLLHVDEKNGEGLTPLVLDALRKHSHELDPVR